MPPDAKGSDTRSWLGYSLEDLRAAEVCLAASPPLIPQALFSAQQAAEKALKAFLLWHDVPFPPTHDLRVLAELAFRTDRDLAPVVSRSMSLTQYAVRIRYPVQTPDPTEADARSELSLAREVVQGILDRLPPEVRP